MGMAASQARFLNLTARKTNIEFHGQQINQQRTELSNESANLYNQMLTLQVPVPPNTQDYTKVQYTFTIPGSYDTLATVTQFSKDNNGTYSVLFNYTETELGFPACTTKQRSDVTNMAQAAGTYAMVTDDSQKEQIRKNGTDYQYNNGSWTNLTALTSAPDSSTEPLYSAWNQFGASSTEPLYYYGSGTNTHVFTAAQVAALAAGSPGGPQDLNFYTPTSVHSNYQGETITTYKGKTATLSYVDANGIHKDAYDALSNGGATDVWVTNVGTEDKPVYQYYTSTDITASKSASGDNRVVYYTASDVTKYKEDSYDGVTLSRDGNNRVQSFNYNGEDYAVSANTITDDEAYNNAMNEYTYQSYLYEQEMNKINAQISIVHAQDRELELKLKQLDTEHNAVQTEIETVKQISKKNVEDSFKTFA